MSGNGRDLQLEDAGPGRATALFPWTDDAAFHLMVLSIMLGRWTAGFVDTHCTLHGAGQRFMHYDEISLAIRRWPLVGESPSG